MKEELGKLLDSYYRGKTTEEEEKFLKKELLLAEENLPEKDIFSFYSSASGIPEETENFIFGGIEEKARKRNLRKMITLFASAAAVFLMVILYSGYLDQQKTRKNLAVMEQALSVISKGIQPPGEEPDMLVLWVDNNVEVIIN